MHRIEKTQSLSWNRIWECGRAFGLTLLLCLFPLAVWAQEDEHEPGGRILPLDPQAKQAQIVIFGVIAAIVIAVAIFYYLRRWQLMHSDNVQEGFEHDDD